MKLLSESFTKGSVQYTQLRRDGNVVLFRREKNTTSPKCHWIDFEVIKIRARKEAQYTTGEGVVVKREACESYPSDDDWGFRGWTFQTEDYAIRKYESVLQEVQEALNLKARKEFSTFSPSGCHIVPEQASGGLES
jgi:hypothetical protein